MLYSYANGRYVPTEELALPVASDAIGTFRGFRIFTACRTLASKVFRLQDHINRLFNSARLISMELPHSKDVLRDIIEKTLAENRQGVGVGQGTIGQGGVGQGDLLLEIIYSGGPAGLTGLAPAGAALLYILVLPLKLPPATWYRQGIKLAAYAYQRQWPEVKLLNYVGGVIAHQTVVKEYGADEALFVSPDEQKIILEGDTFNFFVVNDGCLITHPLNGKILPGITRRVALKLAQECNIPNKEDYFAYNNLSTMDEAFITSSTRNVVPVVKVDDIAIGEGVPGKITKRLIEAFEQEQRDY